VSNLPNPYNVVSEPDETYSFITDKGVIYIITFSDVSHYCEDIKPIFEFSLYPKEETIPKNKNGKAVIPSDSRISETIQYFLLEFFEVNDRCLLFVCDSLDSKHEARSRRFNMWFTRLNSDVLEKYDHRICIDNESNKPTIIIGSLIIHCQNEDKEIILGKISESITLKY